MNWIIWIWEMRNPQFSIFKCMTKESQSDLNIWEADKTIPSFNFRKQFEIAEFSYSMPKERKIIYLLPFFGLVRLSAEWTVATHTGNGSSSTQHLHLDANLPLSTYAFTSTFRNGFYSGHSEAFSRWSIKSTTTNFKGV